MDNNQGFNNRGFNPQGQSYNPQGQSYNQQVFFQPQQPQTGFDEIGQTMPAGQQMGGQQFTGQQYNQTYNQPNNQTFNQPAPTQIYNGQQGGFTGGYNQGIGNSGYNGDNQNGGGKKTGLIIGIILAVVAIIAAIVVVIVLKNKKDDEDNSDKKTTTEVTTTETATTEMTTTEAVTTEAATTEERTDTVGQTRYYRLTGASDIEDPDYDYMADINASDAMENYSFMVLSDDTHTGYIVIMGELLGEVTYDDSSMTMGGLAIDMSVSGNTVTLSSEGETLVFTQITEEEFEPLQAAYDSSDYDDSDLYGTTLTQATDFTVGDLHFTCPADFLLIIDEEDLEIGWFEAELYKDDRCVSDVYVEVVDDDLAASGNSAEAEAGSYDDWTDFNYVTSGGVTIQYYFDGDYTDFEFEGYYGSQTMANSNWIDGYIEYNNKLYRVSIIADTDYYGSDVKSIAMSVLDSLHF